MILPSNFSVETKRLLLRPPEKSDIPHIFSATRHPNFNDGMMWNQPQKIEELYPLHKRALNLWKQGEIYTFSIIGKNSGKFIGRIELRDHKNDIWNIGFFTVPSEQQKGFMTEATSKILQVGFINLNAKRIESCHALWNTSSKKVLTNNGLSFRKHEPQGYQKRGEWVAQDLLAINSDDWKENVSNLL